jgi:hypothetical protein
MELRDTGTSGPVTDMDQGITARDIFTVIRGIGVIGLDKTLPIPVPQFRVVVRPL